MKQITTIVKSNTGWFVIAIALLIAAALRLWGGLSLPYIEWDEPVYARIAENYASGYGIVAKWSVETIEYNSYYLYHPPFYFVLLGEWFKTFGAGIGQARVLSVVMSLAAIILLVFWMKGQAGTKAAAITAFLLATDGWLIFTNRISLIENTQLILFVFSIALYTWALKEEKNSAWKFALAGLMIGFTVAYKHLAVYLLIMPLVTLFFGGKKMLRPMLIALTSAYLVLIGYVFVMIMLYDGLFAGTFSLQVERMMGLRPIQGSVTIVDMKTALLNQYGMYAVTVVLIGMSSLTVLYRAAKIYYGREKNPVELALVSWALAAMIFFSIIKLALPQYWVLIILPLYAFFGYTVAKKEFGYKKTICVLAAIIFVFQTTIILVNFENGYRNIEEAERVIHRGYWIHGDEAVLDVQRRARFSQEYVEGGEGGGLNAIKEWFKTKDQKAPVLAEEPIGAIIEQPYLRIRVNAYPAAWKEWRPKYIVTYDSLTRENPKGEELSLLLQLSQYRGSATDFKAIYKIYEVEDDAMKYWDQLWAQYLEMEKN